MVSGLLLSYNYSAEHMPNISFFPIIFDSIMGQYDSKLSKGLEKKTIISCTNDMGKHN